MEDAVSVIVPIYNRAAIVPLTLDSVAAQSVRVRRLVCVDDGSTDGGAKVVDAWRRRNESQFGEFVLIRQPNRGVAAARNRGLAVAEDCRWVAFLDSDDCWPCDFVERATAALAARSDAVAASCNRVLRCDHGTRLQAQDLSPLATDPIAWMFEHGAGIASATLFDAARVRMRGGFDEALSTGEDAALFLRLSLDGPWLHLPGRASLIDRSVGSRPGAEGNLSGKFRDNCRRWAAVYQDFVLHGGGDRALSPAACRYWLSVIWSRAGRELALHGEFADARACYLASLGWHLVNLRTWQRLWLALVAQWTGFNYLAGPTISAEARQSEQLPTSRDRNSRFGRRSRKAA